MMGRDEMKRVIGARIADLRDAAGMTQQNLADVLAVTRAAIGQKERGASSFNISEVMKMSELFSVTTDFIITGRTDAAPEGLTEQEEILLKFFRASDPEAKLDSLTLVIGNAKNVTFG